MNRLNLLPDEIKKEIEFSKKNAIFAQNLWRLLAVFFVLLGLLVVIGTIAKTNEDIYKADRDSSKNQVERWSNTENNAKDFATRLNLIDKIDKDSINWTLVLEEVAKATPPKVKLQTLNFTGDGAVRISFTGFASTDKDVVTFRELLSKSKIFEFVDIESITQSSDQKLGNGKVFLLTMNMKIAEVKK